MDPRDEPEGEHLAAGGGNLADVQVEDYGRSALSGRGRGEYGVSRQLHGARRPPAPPHQNDGRVESPGLDCRMGPLGRAALHRRPGRVRGPLSRPVVPAGSGLALQLA